MSRILIVTVLAGLMVFIYIAWFWPSFSGSSDIRYYADIGDRVSKVIEGEVGLLQSEYPPAPSVLFYWLLKNTWGWSFYDAWPAFLLMMIIGGAVWAELWLGRGEALILFVSVIGTYHVMQSIVLFARYDVIIGLLLLLMWRAHLHQKFAASGLLLLLAAAFKLVPAALLPVVYWNTSESGRKWLLVGIGVGLLLVVIGPILVVGWEANLGSVLHMIKFHGGRGFQVESTWSGINMLINNLHGRKSLLSFHHVAVHNDELMGLAADLSRLGMLFGLAVAYILNWERRHSGGSERMLLNSMALLLWILFVSPILSPQFLIWIMPTLVAWVFVQLIKAKELPWEVLVVSFLIVLIGLCTQWIWPFHYDQFTAQVYLRNTYIINTRNVLLLVLAMVFLFLSFRKDRGGSYKNRAE